MASASSRQERVVAGQAAGKELPGQGAGGRYDRVCAQRRNGGKRKLRAPVAVRKEGTGGQMRGRDAGKDELLAKRWRWRYDDRIIVVVKTPTAKYVHGARMLGRAHKLRNRGTALEAQNFSLLREVQPWRFIQWRASKQTRRPRRHSSNCSARQATWCHAHLLQLRQTRSPSLRCAKLEYMSNYSCIAPPSHQSNNSCAVVRPFQTVRRRAELIVTCPRSMVRLQYASSLHTCL